MKQILIRLPAPLKEKLKEQANKRGLSFNAYVLIIINEFIEEQNL